MLGKCLTYNGPTGKKPSKKTYSSNFSVNPNFYKILVNSKISLVPEFQPTLKWLVEPWNDLLLRHYRKEVLVKKRLFNLLLALLAMLAFSCAGDELAGPENPDGNAKEDGDTDGGADILDPEPCVALSEALACANMICGIADDHCGNEIECGSCTSPTEE
jgi:hypothetical protein